MAREFVEEQTTYRHLVRCTCDVCGVELPLFDTSRPCVVKKRIDEWTYREYDLCGECFERHVVTTIEANLKGA